MSQKMSFKRCYTLLDVTLLEASATQWFAVSLSKVGTQAQQSHAQSAHILTAAIYGPLTPLTADTPITSSALQHLGAPTCVEDAAILAAFDSRASLVC